MCVASETFGVILAIINSLMLTLEISSVILFETGYDCQDCLTVGYIVIFLVLNPLLLYGYGYVLAWIACRKQRIGPQIGALEPWQVLIAQIIIVISLALSIIDSVLIAVGGIHNMLCIYNNISNLNTNLIDLHSCN